MVIFNSEKISSAMTRIFGINGEQMYLVEGREQAALIDTGSGVGDLKGYVSTLTGLPLIVLITHAHIDHAMGAGQFDQVFMSRMDNEVYEKQCTFDMQTMYLSSSPRYSDLTQDDYKLARPLSMILDLRDGDSFDLGGLTIEAVLCSGHSPGSMMFLIREERILIAGDACSFFTMLQDKSCLDLPTFENSVAGVKARMQGRFDAVLMSHGRMPVPLTLFDEILELCQEIKAGQDDKIPLELWGTSGRVAKAYGSNYLRIDGKFGNIVYDPDRI